MAYDIVDRETENFGSLHYEKLVLDITSLAAAGAEAIAPTAETRLVDRAIDVHVAGQVTGGYTISYDHVNEQINVTESADLNQQHADVAAGTAVGQVELVVVGK